MLTYQNIKNNSTRSIDARLYNDEYFDFMLYRGEVLGIDYNINEKLILDFTSLNIEDGILYSDVTWDGAVNNDVSLNDIGFTGIDNGLIHFEKDKISNSDFLKILTGSTYEIDSGDTRFFMTPITGNTKNFIYPMFLENKEEKYISFKGGFYQGFYKLFGFDYQVLPNGPDIEWNLQFNIRPRSDYKVEIESVNYIHPNNNGIFFYMGTRAENKFLNLYKTDSAVTEPLKIASIENDGYLDSTECDGEKLSIQNKVVSELEYTPDLPKFKNNIEEKTVEGLPINEDDECESYFADNYYDKKGEDPCNCIKKKTLSKGTSKCDREYDVEYDMLSIPGNKWHISDLYAYKYDETSVNCCKDCGGGGGGDESECVDQSVPDCLCDEYFLDLVLNKDKNDKNHYFKVEECGKGDKSLDEEYLMTDEEIDEKRIEDTFGHLITKKGYYEIVSDNKFLMFDRTPLGFTVNNWIEDTKVTLTGRNDWGNINYFPLMNRTKTGYTVNDIYKYQEENSIPYNIYKDIKNNAFALRITENGAIGYRYAMLDCNADNEQHYTVKEEYSKENIIKYDEWNNVLVKIVILNPSQVKFRKNGSMCEDYKKGKRKMKLYFYVNGNLVFISQELDEFNFRELNDNYQKQEAVPFNISLGGGTQGLLESVLPDYYKFSEYMFPIERDFCGTFLGDIKSFKIFNGYLNYPTIKNLKI